MIRDSKRALASLALLGVAAASGGYLYVRISSNYIYTDKASISAQTVDLAPQNAGVLQEVFVHQGDIVNANTVVARVDNELIKAKFTGTVVTVDNSIGKLFNRGEAVVTMVDPTDLHVVGHVDEDKGLSEIAIGQHAVFTVDTFGSRQYEGVVEEISPTSRQGDVVFNISDKRETSVFDVKVRYDVGAYPELQNGMSAKLWIYKN